MARDVAVVVGLIVTRQSSPEVEEAMEEEKVADNEEEKDWSPSFLDTLVLDGLVGGQAPQHKSSYRFFHQPASFKPNARKNQCRHL